MWQITTKICSFDYKCGKLVPKYVHLIINVIKINYNSETLLLIGWLAYEERWWLGYVQSRDLNLKNNCHCLGAHQSSALIYVSMERRYTGSVW